MGGCLSFTSKTVHSIAESIGRAGFDPETFFDPHLSDAAPLLEAALAGRLSLLGEPHAASLASVASLGRLLARQGKLDEALPLLRAFSRRAGRILSFVLVRVIGTGIGLVARGVRLALRPDKV